MDVFLSDFTSKKPSPSSCTRRVWPINFDGKVRVLPEFSDTLDHQPIPNLHVVLLVHVFDVAAHLE